jgi:hippurate hydrolase
MMSTSRPDIQSERTAGGPGLETKALERLLPKLVGLYIHLHRNPELSRQERETARVTATWLREAGFAVTENVGGYGVVGLLANGVGPTVMLRADMDALPVEEQTGLRYASRTRSENRHGLDVPVMHACGHDLHTSCLLGAASHLSATRSAWSGTLLAVAQPAEEEVSGARAMLDDGLFERFPRPGIVLGQHTWPAPLGTLGHRPGVLFGACTRLAVTLYGRGGHSSTPYLTTDPVVASAHLATRLQTIVARETPPDDRVVVTVGVLRAGTAANIIPDSAYLEIDLRAATSSAMARTMGAVERIVHAEAAACAAPREPDIAILATCPPVVNDDALDERIRAAHAAHFGEEHMIEQPFTSTAEDFAEFAGEGVLLDFWTLGISGHPQATTSATPPPLHSPLYAPADARRALSFGTEALVVAALEMLDRGRGACENEVGPDGQVEDGPRR